MKLHLYFERTYDGDEIDSEGIVLDNVELVYVTYMDMLRVQFTDRLAKESAMNLTGWDEWDTEVLEASIHANRIMVKRGASVRYFADWSVE